MLPRLLLPPLLVGLLASASAQTNDNFTGRLVLSGSRPTALANNLAATREPGEPNHGANGFGRSLWWTWTAPGTGVYNVSAYGGSMGNTPPRVIAIYTGDAVPALTEIASTNNRNTSGSYDEISNNANATLFAGGASVNLSATAGTTYQIAVDARASSPYTPDDGTVVLSINLPPTIVCAASVNVTVGTAFQQSVLANNGATAFAATNLPVGLSINGATGLVSGTPTVKGSYPVALSATGPGGTGTATFTIQVNDPSTPAPTVPLFNGSAGARGFIGQPFSYYPTTSSATTTTYTATNLPGGLTSSGQQISGTPTTAGTFQVPLTATNAVGTSTATLTISISDLPKPPFFSGSLAITGTVGGSVYQSYYADSESNAGAVTVTATGLPPGLTMSASGLLSGTPTQEGVYSATLSATNGGGSQTGVVTITVGPSNPVSPSQPVPPVCSSRAVVSGTAGTAFAYTLGATSLPTSFGAGNLPAGLSLNPSTGVISGTPGVSGTFQVPVSASNSYGTGTATLTINLAAAGSQPSTDGLVLPLVISPASAVGNLGQSLSYTLTAIYGTSSYSSNGPWTFTASALPPGLKLAASTSFTGSVAISGTPTTAGTYAANVTATIPAGTSSSPHPALTASAVVIFVIRDAPAVSTVPFVGGSAGVSWSVGSPYSYSVPVSGSPTSYSASGLPPGLTMSTSTGTVSGTPATAGTYQATLSATNGAGTGSAVVTFTISPQQTPLIYSAASASAVVGTAFTYAITAGGNNTAYGATNLPPGLTCDAAGTISGTPTTAGVYRVALTVANAAGTGTATLTLTVSATASAIAPILTSPAAALGTVGTSFYYNVYGSPGFTGCAVTNLPPGLTSVTDSRYISGTPTTAGTYLVPISATGPGGVSNATLTVIIAPSTLPPILSGNAMANQTAGQSFYYYIYASNSPTSYGSSGLPTGLSLNSSTGMISGTISSVGIYRAGVSATNAYGTSNATVTFNVVPPVQPVITSALGAAAVLGNTFTYQAQATEAVTSYGISSVPAGLTFSSANGLLTGKPTSAGTYDLQVTATNPVGTARVTVRLVVTAGAVSAPTITSAAEATGTTGNAFSYTVYASTNPTGYGAVNLPPGLSFASATGVLSGTPTSPGTYTVPLTVANASGSGGGALTVVVTDPVPAVPVLALSNPLVFRASLGSTSSLYVTANNAPTGYAATGLPPGISLNAATGLISGVPTATGTYPVTVSASNAVGTSASAVVTMVAGGSIPAFTSTPLMADAYATVAYSDSGLYASNSPTSYTADGLPAGLTLGATSGYVAGTPTTQGRSQVSLSATNAAGTGHAVWTVIVNDPATLKPTFDTSTGASLKVGIGTSFSSYLRVNTTDGVVSPDLPLALSYEGLPPGVSGVATGTSNSIYTGGYFSGVPTLAGVYPVTVTAATPAGVTASTVVTVVVATPAPYINSAASVAGYENTPLAAYALTSTPAAKSYTASGLPPGLSLNASTGSITGTPTTAGTYTAAVTAAGTTGTASGVLTFQIGPPLAGGLPIITSAASAGYQDGLSSYFTGTTAFAYTINALNSPTGFAATGLPAGLSFNPYNGNISGYPVANGTYQVTVQASNPVGSVQATLMIVVTGSSPVLTAPLGTDGYLNRPLTAFIGTTAKPSETYYVSSGSVLDPATYAASGLPPGLSVNTYSGSITGTATQLGVYPVVFSVTNRAGTATCISTFRIAVMPASGAASPPSFYSQIMATGLVGQSLSYGLAASGATSYTALGLPAGLSLNGTTGQMTGTPTTAGVFLVPVAAINDAGTAQATLTIRVDATGRVPYVQSSLAMSATLGSTYYGYISSDSYTGVPPTTLYTASNLPAGLNFNQQTGGFSGVPSGPAGTFPIPVSITRGGLTATAVVTFSVIPPAAPLNPLTVASSAATLGLTGYPLNYPVIDKAFAPVSALPAGLAFDPATAILSGTPMSSGTYQIPLATTAANGERRATVTLNIVDPTLAPPRISSQPTGGTVLQNGDFSLAATAVAVPPPAYQWYHNGLPVPGATKATLILQMAQPADTGTYTLAAANLAGSISSAGANVLVQQSFETWQDAHFTRAEIAAGLAADGADPDEDGLVNLLEYALGTNPRARGSNGLPTALYPTSDNRLRFSFVRDAGRPDLDYVVEASADLQGWAVVAESDAGGPLTASGNASTVMEQAVPGTSQLTATVEVSQNAGASSRRFMRLRIERNQ